MRPMRQLLYDTEPIKKLPGRHRPRRCRSHHLKVAWKKWARTKERKGVQV